MQNLDPSRCVLVFDGEQCSRPVHNKTLGYCNAHYLQARRGQTLRRTRYSSRVYGEKPCTFEGCKNTAVAKGLCHAHRWQLKHRGELKPLYGSQVERYGHCRRDSQDRKKCYRCYTWKAETEFSISNRSADGLKSWCRECRASDRGRRTDEDHARKVSRRYNVPVDWYWTQFSLQGGVCAICGSPPGVKRLAVDHDHACCPGPGSCGNCIRGLLCPSCNSGLGIFKDDVQLFSKAVNYLKANGVIE